MNIAQIVPVWGIYKPETATGINLVAREVIRGLIKCGHNVTVIAPKGSIKEDKMNLIETIEPLTKRKLSLFDEESTAYSLIHASIAVSHASSFDVIHNHMEHLFLPFAQLINTPVVSTIHGVNFPPTAKALFTFYKNHPYISISQKSKEVLPFVNFFDTVYNGINISSYQLSSQKGKNLVFLGRLVPEKGAHIAIEVARLTGLPLVIAGQKEAGAEAYFQEIQKKAASLNVTFFSWLDFPVKIKLLQEAYAVLFPINWEEPFGLVMVEAMACGTPVIAFARGSVPEVVVGGVTGFVVEPNRVSERVRPLTHSERVRPLTHSERVRPLTHSRSDPKWVIKNKGIDGLVEAVRRITSLSSEEYRQMRLACRKHVEEHFTVEKMVEGYERVYKKVLAHSP